MTSRCLWCGDTLRGRKRRGSARRFCGTDCRRDHHSALRELGGAVADKLFPAPGELRMWSIKACTLSSGVKSSQKVSDTGEPEVGRLWPPEGGLSGDGFPRLH